MRIRIQIITLAWIRIQLIGLMRIRILNFNLMRIRILASRCGQRYRYPSEKELIENCKQKEVAHEKYSFISNFHSVFVSNA
jgi:hypothetical protein